MRLNVMIASLICMTGITATARAQYIDQIGTSDGLGNTGVGSNTLYKLTEAYEASGDCPGIHTFIVCGYNTAIGFGSLFANTQGYENSANGYQALYSNVAGIENTATGFQALFNNTDSFNSAFGAWALVGHTTGQFNTAVGYGALAYG